MIWLRSGRLAVQLEEPGEVYRRARFDWSGICQQITLDGEINFCSREATADDPGTEGVGLIDEFGIETPIGYDEIPAGEWFPKIGVGFLQKLSDDPYDFMVDYPLNPVSIDTEIAGEHLATFVQKSEIMNGWGWKLQKALSVTGTNLTIDYILENIGEKPFTTEQYNHNFAVISGQTIGPDYKLEASFPFKFDVLDGGVVVEDHQLALTEIPPTYIYALQMDCTGLQSVEWKLVHQPSGHGLRGKEGFPLFKHAVWAKSHAISPEFFIAIDLKPGETQTWRREYTFF